MDERSVAVWAVWGGIQSRILGPRADGGGWWFAEAVCCLLAGVVGCRRILVSNLDCPFKLLKWQL
jgi:hypothetical protein